MKTTHGSSHKPSHGATSDTRQAPQEQKEKTRKKKTKNTNSGQNHKEKAPRKAAHILREKKKKRSAIYVGNPSCERLGGEFLGCWKCWKCWECWKIYDFSTLSMFSMLSMLQKEGNAAQDTPLLRTQFAPNTAQGSAQVPQGRNSTAGATAQHRGSAQTPQGRNSTAGATAQRRGSAQVPQGRHSTAGATAQCRGAHKLRRAARHGKSDSSGKQERGRQALRSYGFGGRCSENL